MRQPKAVAKTVVPVIKRYTIESVSKYYYRNEKNLLELLLIFPNFGQGFKAYMKIRPQDYYIIDHINIKNNRHGRAFGSFYKNGILQQNKITQIKKTLQHGRWLFEPPIGTFFTENGVEYDIHKIQKLIAEKKDLLDKRYRMLDIPDPEKQELLEMKKKKQELAKKKK